MKETKEVFDMNVKNMNTTMATVLVGTLSGFIGGNITSCKLQDLINKKQYINYLILFFVIFVTQGWQGDKPPHPVHKLLLTLLVMLYFVMIMRNNYIAIIIGFSLLLAANEIKSYRNYVNTTPTIDFKKDEEKKLKNIQKICETLGLTSFGIGFVVNFAMKTKNPGFNVIKHLFGKCE